MSKRALITGITGQDGAYLAKLLLEKGYRVFGGYRRSATESFERLEILGIDKDINCIPFELLDITSVKRAIEKADPDEVYNLAAQSFVGISFDQPIFTSQVNGIGTLNILETLRAAGRSIRFYQASTSEMFGLTQNSSQDENTRFHPRSPYAVSKLFAHWATVNYREAYQFFACSGILFNHESPLRGEEFVTRKITKAVARIKSGKQEKLLLGNLDAQRDWGYAPEYVEAMWRMLQLDEPEDFVIGTGDTNTIRAFAEIAFRCAGMNLAWEGEGIEEVGVDRQTGKVLVEVSPLYFRPTEVHFLKANPDKAKKRLGWSAKTAFETLVSIMAEADMAWEQDGTHSKTSQMGELG